MHSRKCLQGLTSPGQWMHSLLTLHCRTGKHRSQTGRLFLRPGRQVPFMWLPSPLSSKAHSWGLHLAEGGEGNCFVEPALKGKVRPSKWKLGQSRWAREGQGSSGVNPYDLDQPWATFCLSPSWPLSLLAVHPGPSSSLPAPVIYHCFPYYVPVCVLVSAFPSFLLIFIY